jgi:pilus assembly protein Flp/PilA
MSIALITIRSWLAAALPSRDDDRGASLVEYALLVAFIAIVCALAIGYLGGTVNDSYSSTGSGFTR